MSTTPRSQIDLSKLSRPADEGTHIPSPRRRWLWWLVPIVLLFGFGLVFFDTVRRLLEEEVPVTVVRPRPSAATTTSAGEVIFQTAGWVQPDPYRIRVTALADGVIQKLLVQESDVVKKGDPVALLVPDDANLALARAEAALAAARAEEQAAQVELDNAKEAFEAAIEVTEARDVARAAVRGREAEQKHRAEAVREGEAAVRVATEELKTQRYLRQQNAAGPWQVELAEAKVDEAEARLAILRSDAALAVADAETARANRTRAERDFELRLAERLRVGRAEAALPKAKAKVAEAEALRDEAKLRLERMTVRATADGIVLSRDADQGTVVGPRASDASVCHLYDPKSLRVRVDVPQNQVARASVGQRAEIRCDVRRNEPYRGEVIRVVQTADIQKVTLEVQVRILDPDGLIKPEMLAQVAVFGDGDDDRSAPSSAVTIPARCLVGDSVWVVDADGRAARRLVRTGTRTGEDVVVTSGLNLSDKVIDGGAGRVEPGTPVRVEERR